MMNEYILFYVLISCSDIYVCYTYLQADEWWVWWHIIFTFSICFSRIFCLFISSPMSYTIIIYYAHVQHFKCFQDREKNILNLDDFLAFTLYSFVIIFEILCKICLFHMIWNTNMSVNYFYIIADKRMCVSFSHFSLFFSRFFFNRLSFQINLF